LNREFTDFGGDAAVDAEPWYYTDTEGGDVGKYRWAGNSFVCVYQYIIYFIPGPPPPQKKNEFSYTKTNIRGNATPFVIASGYHSNNLYLKIFINNVYLVGIIQKIFIY
jgi:hypothetical protein